MQRRAGDIFLPDFNFLEEHEIDTLFSFSVPTIQVFGSGEVKAVVRMMGEVVESSEDVKEVKTDSETEEKEDVERRAVERRRKKKEGSSKGMAGWERFLQRIALRVLLVEADDSTRQIIAALLRKCSYKVAAVPDGLKAWEILKEKPQDIDLILTEVDLPLISGFALLTLTIEHEICKNIPVIMMSSQDSISTVHKCMMRGAADYLVKPIRRNELRNLWQHVWRRKSSIIIGGDFPQDESVGEQKAEATSENNAASNHASGYMACVPRNNEPLEKGSEAQSSCTKPNLQAESAQMENMQELSLLARGKPLLEETEKHEPDANFSQKLLRHESETRGMMGGACDNDHTINISKGAKAESQGRDAFVSSEACDAIAESSTELEAIDFMGTFNNQHSSSVNGTVKFDSHPGLNLTLSSYPNHLENHVTQEVRTLWHPKASAFTRYTSRPSHPLHSTLTSVNNQQKEFGIDSKKNLSNVVTGCNSDTPSLTLSTLSSVISLATAQSKHTELVASCPQQKVFPALVQVKGIRLNNLCAGYDSVLPPSFYNKSSASPVPSPSPSPSPSNQQEHAFRVNPFNKSEQLYDHLVPNEKHSTNKVLQKLDKLDSFENKLDSFEDRGQISPATDQSTTSNFCNGARTHLNGSGCGNACACNGDVDQVTVVNASVEGRKEDGLLSPSGNSDRSIQREAALTKFRLKRKDRCYEKKVWGFIINLAFLL
ncbi:hypothetical protein SLEP1_g3179 [Rubroshorea leprosula]|uniref:Response regulatory domain-containing protein n=1 Tax=Rubroshorea leprosula TaxID=152421 RepID=A0AAV5HUY6_9ROSI|nr:hypothetical protein SLEP1_g3179 [Rubroshorea leprosula]